ncbi:hypothetical protein SAMN04489761_2009 [Tenacibaculum sp. MAR_2009_124]|uniref:hypothetical protein n=1 Tax=Tenacibaculum sp. MAR_2009_124 TaxID=1250059 RepID=UPI0008964EB2|nr:hypothetical protein [Tenacibaculum sp. MAR_2009_124]SEB87034.1 hypothetical protein SAMN04489761_2009 [Tenacibaculum sp. MAR_2009_124]
MTKVEHKYLKIYDGVMTGSSVELEISPNNLKTNRIIIDSEKIPFRSQGLIEGGHENWNKSAKQALDIGLEKLNISDKLDITVKKLEGRIFIDTNNASVGIACILALWKYHDFQPEYQVMGRIDEFVKEDWKNDVDIIPDFKMIFEN